MRAVFLIHGFASDREDFGRLAPLLSAYYDEVFCPNLPGHGPGTKKERMDNKQILQFVDSSFEQLSQRYDTIDVIGFSMGGALATYLACNKNVNRLILLAPANKYFAPFFLSRTVKWIFKASREERRKKKGKVVISQNTVSVSELLSDTRKAFRLFLGKMMKKINAKNLSEFSRLIKSCNNCLKDKEIAAPALIIWGRLDQLVPFSSLKHVTKYCRNTTTRTHIWPDMSHSMLYSRLHFKITHEIFCFLKDTDPPLLGYTYK